MRRKQRKEEELEQVGADGGHRGRGWTCRCGVIIVLFITKVRKGSRGGREEEGKEGGKGGEDEKR